MIWNPNKRTCYVFFLSMFVYAYLWVSLWSLCVCHQLQDGHYIDASMLQKDSQIDNEKESGLITNSNSSATQLKERLSSHIGYRCKSDSFRFVEYWVPVQISNLQLEQYCSILLSNASILRSSSKVDSVEAVRDVLISTRKVRLYFLNKLHASHYIKDNIKLV